MDIRIAVVGLALAHLAPPAIFAQNAEDDIRRYIVSERIARPLASDPTEAGRGWLTFGETAKARCVEAAVKPSEGYHFDSQVFYVETRQQYERVMMLSRSASAKYYGASGSAAYNLSKSLKLDNQSFTLTGYQVYIGGVDIAVEPTTKAPNLGPSMRAYLEEPSLEVASAVFEDIPVVRLSKDAVALLKKSTDQFLERCGDSYVTSVSYGGQQIASLVLQTGSREEKRSVSEAYSASAGTSIGGMAAVTKTETVRKFNESKRLRIYLSESGAEATVVPVDLPTFQERVKQFQTGADTKFSKSKTPIFVTLRRYDMIEGWPEEMEIPANWEAGPSLASAEKSLEDLRTDIQSVLASPGEYIYDSRISEASLRAAQDVVEEELGAVRAAREECMPKPSKCVVDGRWLHDYEIRTALPAHQGDVANWKALRKQKGHLKRVLAKYRKHVRDRNNITLTMRDCPAGGGIARTLCSSFLKQVNDRKRAVEKQEELVRVQSAGARIEYWVRRVDEDRCNGGPRQWGCVGPAQVTAYEATALTKEPHGVATTRATAMDAVFRSAAEKVQSEQDPATSASAAAWDELVKEASASGVVTVDCSCRTKGNPSWCETNLGQFQTIKWAQNPFKPDDADWDAAFLAEYCQRHADIGCMCTDVKYFEGKESAP
jgi:hypothetical protein